MNEEPFTDQADPTEVNAKKAFKELGDAARRAFEAGGEEARSAAKAAAPKLKQGVQEGLHDISWTIGYIGAFATTLARSLVPEAAKSGFVEGAGSGRAAAENLGKKTESSSPDSVEIVVTES